MSDLHPGYSFFYASDTREQCPMWITLTQKSTGRKKSFFMASANDVGMSRHLRSLTDEQCADWFKPPRKEKKHE